MDLANKLLCMTLYNYVCMCVHVGGVNQFDTGHLNYATTSDDCQCLIVHLILQQLLGMLQIKNCLLE